ncbi:hypothetical protein HYT05_03815 [Candidatus Kaiserbacteria bacterium]|nr:hypothetical protein [Candidatus Kaiserbacteria bacterium]
MHNTKILWGIIIILIISTGIYFAMVKKVEAPTDGEKAAAALPFDPQNATYMIDGQPVTLVNGLSEVEAAPGSATKTTTRYFGNEARGDLNGDGQEDLAYLITYDGGGSGLFYFVAAAIKSADGYKIANPFLVGDRIAPQTTEIVSGELRVNYAERKPGEPMTAQPSVGVTMRLKIAPDGTLQLAK